MPAPTLDQIKKLYSEEYFEDNTRNYSYTQQVVETKQAYRMTAVKFRELVGAGCNMLDIGCATGDFLVEADKLGFNATGIEYSAYGYSECQKKNLNVVQANINDVDFQDAQFDAVHVSHVLEHLENPDLTLKRIVRWVKPAGLIYIEVPHQFDGWLEKIQSIRNPKSSFDVFSIHHCSFFGPKSLTRLIKNNGLEIVNICTYDPNKRSARKPSIRKLFLMVLLATANLFHRGDIIAAWIRVPKIT
ncbi:MAG: class I SAM-dependent methyltransferase [Desulfobacteraceae bacterium]|jgi:2-polyprenyl-3-methyl-5-hydroxy-6-metoxy-1,4-benzoquinol methylase